MHIGMIGLGRMGGQMTQRLLGAGHDVVAFDVDRAAVERASTDGAVPAGSIADLVARLPTPRCVWVMLPAPVVGDILDDVVPHLETDDIVIDGGNSFWRDDLPRSAALGERGIHYVDVGVSGGVWGLDEGYCLMIGGDAEPVARLEPVFTALAPGVDRAPRLGDRTDDPSPAEQGWLHCGPSGAGHFVKMVHNGVEYGLMAAYAEGLAILEAARRPDSVPGSPPVPAGYTFDLAAVTEVWRRGSVVRSWLLDLIADQLRNNPDLEGFSGEVADSGEGRWTVQTAVDLGVPTDVIAAALFSRFSSRDASAVADRALSAMRAAFGGHGDAPD